MIYRDISEEQLIALITEQVKKELGCLSRQVPVGISARHVHLEAKQVEQLFGPGHKLTVKKWLSQPGQYACEETLELVGPRGTIRRVRVLGPERKAAQVEVAKTDARVLGIDAPVRGSGDVKGTPGITLRGPAGELILSEGVIIADRHIHMTPGDAAAFGVSDGEQVSVWLNGEKGGILDKVRIRVSDSYALDFHVDTDDASAFLLEQGQQALVLTEGYRIN